MMSTMMFQMTGLGMPQRIAPVIGRQGARKTTLFVLASRLQANLPNTDVPKAPRNPIESEFA